MRNRHSPSTPDTKPSWWKVVVGVVVGVGAGGLAFLVLLWPITLLLDQLSGRSDWQSALRASPDLPMVLIRTIFWTIPFALGQWISAGLSGWSKTIYFAAALQSFHMVFMFPSVELAFLWVLPFVIAAALTKVDWASRAAERGRIAEARTAKARTKN